MPHTDKSAKLKTLPINDLRGSTLLAPHRDQSEHDATQGGDIYPDHLQACVEPVQLHKVFFVDDLAS